MGCLTWTQRVCSRQAAPRHVARGTLLWLAGAMHDVTGLYARAIVTFVQDSPVQLHGATVACVAGCTRRRPAAIGQRLNCCSRPRGTRFHTFAAALYVIVRHSQHTRWATATTHARPVRRCKYKAPKIHHVKTHLPVLHSNVRGVSDGNACLVLNLIVGFGDGGRTRGRCFFFLFHFGGCVCVCVCACVCVCVSSYPDGNTDGAWYSQRGS